MRLHLILFFATLLLACLGCNKSRQIGTEQVIEQRYASISGAFSGEEVEESPDPLVAYRWENPTSKDDLEVYSLYPIWAKCDNERAVEWGGDLSRSFKITEACSILFDFGTVSAAWLEVDSDDLNGDVEFSISEYNEPAILNSGAENRVKTRVPTRYGNTYRLELNKDLYEGVRYAWIHINSLDKPINIDQVRLVCQTRPTNYEGRFWCDDPNLTRIWYTGAYTVKLNLLKEYFGAILMERSDRHSWTGDAHSSQAASLVAFGNFDFVKANILYTASQYNGILSYSLYWVLSLIDYYNYTGDSETLTQLIDNVCGKLNNAYAHYGKNPALTFYGWDERLGAGFEYPNISKEAQGAYKMLSIRTWREFAEAMAQIGRSDLSDTYNGYANEKMSELREDSAWCESAQLFYASDAVNTGLTTSQERESLWGAAFADRIQRVSYSPFNQYFVMQAMARMGRYDQALSTVDDCWGGQIRYGATTFFEVFRPSWVTNDLQNNDAPINNQCGYTSLTHPWSSGVTKWLSEEILGIKPSSPGFKTFEVIPHLSGNLTEIDGAVPTPMGNISFALNTNNGKGRLEVPNNTTATLAIPKMGREIKKISFACAKLVAECEDDNYVYFKDLPQGAYSFKVNYTRAPKNQFEAEPISYKIETPAKFDTATSGDWLGKYGKQGYILYNYNKVGENVTKLPDYIDRVEHKLVKASPLNINYSACSNDPRALIDVSSDRRALGALLTGDPIPCQQTMNFNLYCKQNSTPYTVSLYFVDWDRSGRRGAIEIFDIDNNEILAPVTIVHDSKEGVYVTFELDRSVRLRLNQVRGENLSISGIFFD